MPCWKGKQIVGAVHQFTPRGRNRGIFTSVLRRSRVVPNMISWIAVDAYTCMSGRIQSLVFSDVPAIWKYERVWSYGTS